MSGHKYHGTPYPKGVFIARLRDFLGTYDHGPCRVADSGQVVFAETGTPIKVLIVGWRELTPEEAVEFAKSHGGEQ